MLRPYPQPAPTYVHTAHRGSPRSRPLPKRRGGSLAAVLIHPPLAPLSSRDTPLYLFECECALFLLRGGSTYSLLLAPGGRRFVVVVVVVDHGETTPTGPRPSPSAWKPIR